MRNIPVFTTEFGVASLVLKEIPYKKTACVHIQTTWDLPALLEECTGFCRAAGAEIVYATGHGDLAAYPLFCTVIPMEMNRLDLPETDAAAVPVTEKTLERWRQIYNEKMKEVDHAAFMDTVDARKMLAQGSGYFVMCGNEEAGIVMTAQDKLEALAATAPGGGRECVLVLKKLLTGPRIRLEVASTNTRALKLYESLGFQPCGGEKAWYKIL